MRKEYVQCEPEIEMKQKTFNERYRLHGSSSNRKNGFYVKMSLSNGFLAFGLCVLEKGFSFVDT